VLFFAFGNAIEIENANFGTIFDPKFQANFCMLPYILPRKS
jgi:hypothetical protein